jgi:hypothetical protein
MLSIDVEYVSASSFRPSQPAHRLELNEQSPSKHKDWNATENKPETN